jgi:4-amino-4-deoxy-L-arabinose transferase-like glycosyltransferase
MKGIHDPLLDHPGWRQGDTAAIARNFATLEFNPFRPQTDYNGPPPNYVELELQIVPFLAAILYKFFGVHEIFGRLLTLGFSLLNVGLLAYFARWLFRSPLAGLVAALAFAIYPGSTYYGRTFTPDTAMVACLTAALYVGARWLIDDDARGMRGFWLAAALMALAILAKPVAIVGLVPIAAIAIARFGLLGALKRPRLWAYFAIAILPYVAYDAYVRSIAEWQWASGITSKHVLPELRASFASFVALGNKFSQFAGTLGMLRLTMLGSIGFVAFVTAILMPVRKSARTLLFAWLAAALLYAYVVVTVERVDYYLYTLLPLAALWTGGLAAAVAARLQTNLTLQRAALGAGAALFLAALWLNHAAARPYYRFNQAVYREARSLNRTLAPGTLVVMGHYDPSVLYYINRKGWEEDPALWTPFDEQSAIAKGARYFISIEDGRMRRNLDLCHWLERFPVTNPYAMWPVYETDPAKILPGAEARWQAFRKLEKANKAKPCPALATGPFRATGAATRPN